ncbi:MAG: hypothetical protein IKP68_00720, partial [Clostridia bacterium]|nr:hypothetical protein [Clostridia bacterium]
AGQSLLVIELAYAQNGSEVGEADPEGSVSVYSTEEFEKWLQTCDLEAFFERLKEAGMPESLINEAKEKISK